MEDPEHDKPDAVSDDVEDLDLDAEDAEDVLGGTGPAAPHPGPAGPGG